MQHLKPFSLFRVFGRNEGFKKVFKFDCPVSRPFKLLVSNDKTLLAILSIDRVKNKECVNVYHSRKGILLHKIILKQVLSYQKIPTIFWLVKAKPQWLKITQKVSFNIASYIYNLSGQNVIKNAQNRQFEEYFENCGQTVLPDRSTLLGQILVENAKIEAKF